MKTKTPLSTKTNPIDFDQADRACPTCGSTKLNLLYTATVTHQAGVVDGELRVTAPMSFLAFSGGELVCFRCLSGFPFDLNEFNDYDFSDPPTMPPDWYEWRSE